HPLSPGTPRRCRPRHDRDRSLPSEQHQTATIMVGRVGDAAFGGPAGDGARRPGVGTVRPVYPIALDLAGRRAVVVGGGRVALRRAAGLIESGAVVEVIAPAVLPGLAALDVTVHARQYRDGDLDGAWLAHAATGDPRVNTAVAAEAERRRIWCVRVD